MRQADDTIKVVSKEVGFNRYSRYTHRRKRIWRAVPGTCSSTAEMCTSI